MSATRSNSKTAFFSLLTCIVVLLSFNQFLKSNFYTKLLSSLNGSSYFYLTYDWQKKFFLAHTSRDKEAIVFLGSSRTSNSVNPKTINDPSYNLGLMAGSYNEIDLLSSFMVKTNKKKYKAIFLELNPMSATDRHMKAMSNDENNKMLNIFVSSEASPNWALPLFNNQIYLQRYILNDSIKELFNNKKFPDDYSRFKRNFHVEEFRYLLKNDYVGFTPSPLIIDTYTQDFYRNCSTMTSWSLNNNKESYAGLKKFESTVKNLIKITDKLILWIPPIPKEYIMTENEKIIMRDLQAIGLEFNLKIINLARLTDNSSAFYDCIHLKKESANLVTSTLLKSSVNE